jgi:hypothetical protein
MPREKSPLEMLVDDAFEAGVSNPLSSIIFTAFLGVLVAIFHWWWQPFGVFQPIVDLALWAMIAFGLLGCIIGFFRHLSGKSKYPPIRPSENPLCPTCKSPMVLRTAKRGPTSGAKFYGCSQYPNCTTTLPVTADPAPL